MNILIAPNAFKHSITAVEAADAIAEGFNRTPYNFFCEKFPVGDGGDGTGELIIQKLNGPMYVEPTQDPLGRRITASFGIVHGDTAVIGMANASGLSLLNASELNPLIATTYGTGIQIIQALNRGASRIILTMGGSATIDGGWGIMRALGARFLDAEGKQLDKLSATLHSIDTSGIDPRLQAMEIIVLCDVQNPLLGPYGAAAVFGPQKGASAADVVVLEAALQQFANVCMQQLSIDINFAHCGTAGGAAAGIYALTNARLENGIDYFLQIAGFEVSLNKADIVITAEGSIDRQTLLGKAPLGVAMLAKQKGKKVIALAGQVAVANQQELLEHFDIIETITPPGTDLPAALKNTYNNLVLTSMRIADTLTRKLI